MEVGSDAIEATGQFTTTRWHNNHTARYTAPPGAQVSFWPTIICRLVFFGRKHNLSVDLNCFCCFYRKTGQLIIGITMLRVVFIRCITHKSFSLYSIFSITEKIVRIFSLFIHSLYNLHYCSFYKVHFLSCSSHDFPNMLFIKQRSVDRRIKVQTDVNV